MATRHRVPGRHKKPDLPGNARIVRTTDSPNCTGACGWNATVVDDVIVDLKPAADYPDAEYNPRGCLRGMSMTHMIYGPDRIRTPLIRTGPRGSGQWREASWNEALDYVAGKMTQIREEHGPESLLLFNQVVGTSYIHKGAQIRMAALLGMSFSTAYDYNGDISMGFTQTLGIDSVEMETRTWADTRYAILWSSNVFQTRIPDAQFLTRGAKQNNNATIVVVDPRCSQTAKGADLWVPINPGTDGALALSMCRVLLDENLVDWDFLRTFTDLATLVREDNGRRLRTADLGIGAESEFVVWDANAHKFAVLPSDTLKLPDALQPDFRAAQDLCLNGETVRVRTVFRHLEDILREDQYAPENAAKLTGIPAGQIRRLAIEYATTKPGMIIVGMGLNHRLHGDLTIRSVLLLSALAGQYGVSGSGVGIYSGQHHFRLDISSYWYPEGKRPNVFPLHYFTLGGPTDSINPKIKYPKNGVKGLFISHANPLVTEFSQPLKAAMDGLDLLVVSDFSMSPTCEYADVVLPAPTFWEKYDLVGTGCHPHLQIQQPVISPRHESRTEFWVCQELVKRVAPEMSRYFDMTELDAIRLLLETGGHECAGITLEQLREGPVRLNVPDPEIGLDEQMLDHVPFPPRALPFRVEQQREYHKTGRMEFFKEEDVYWKFGEAFPVYKPAFEHLPEEDQALPLSIVTPHSKWRVHSTHSNNPLLLNINRRPVVEIHPFDAAARGIRDGDEVEVFNRNGAYRLWALHTEAIKPGVVCVDHGWWDRYLAEGKYHGVHTHQKVKPTHETYFLPGVYAPGQHWKDTRVDVRKVQGTPTKRGGR